MKKRLLSLVLALCLIAPMNIIARTENSAKEEGFNGHTYRFYNEKMTWDEAKSFCEEMGGHLATVSSDEENAYLFELMKENGYKSAYFGFSDSKEEGVWEWVTNEPASYTNWYPGEPNAENSKEDYAMFYFKFDDGRWNDGDFGGETVNGGNVFICEWEEKTRGFDLTRDGWSIVNTSKSFSYPEGYLIPSERYYSVENDLKATVIISAKSWLSLFGNTWNGNCFGLSSSAVLNYEGKLDLKPYFSKSEEGLNNYGYDMQSDGFNVLKYTNGAVALIEKLQVSQTTTQVAKSEVFKNADHKEKFSELIAYLFGDDPTPLVLCLSNGLGGHAVVTNTETKPFKTTFNGNDDFYAIKVYDPNTPYDGNGLDSPSIAYGYCGERFIFVNPKTGEWYYKFNPFEGREQWWGDATANCLIAANSSFRCFNVASFADDFINNKLSIAPPDGKTYAFVSASDINLSGTSFFSVNAGEKKVDGNAEHIRFYGATFDLANDKFIGRIELEAGEIFVDGMQNADAVYFSNDNILSISTDDATKYTVDASNNKITLYPSASAEFDIALDNEGSSNFSAVHIKGSSSEGVITISLGDDGVIYASGDVSDFCARVTVENEISQAKSFECNDLTALERFVIDPFADNNSASFGSHVSEWAKSEVEEAYASGLVPEVLVGKDLTQRINRAEFAAIAVALYENLTGTKATIGDDPFSDIAENGCRQEILKAYNLNITTGTSATTFEPDVNITREQMATMLTRAYKRAEFSDWTIKTDANYPLNFAGAEKFADDGEISDYAKESVYFMARHEIIKGVGDNKFAPKSNAAYGESYGFATREQAIIVALRSAKHLR